MAAGLVRRLRIDRLIDRSRSISESYLNSCSHAFHLSASIASSLRDDNREGWAMDEGQRIFS
jgi:hypothetical protein